MKVQPDGEISSMTQLNMNYDIVHEILYYDILRGVNYINGIFHFIDGYYHGLKFELVKYHLDFTSAFIDA